jgi:hypothetical protein
MKKSHLALLVFALALLPASCGRDKPSAPDGQSAITIVAVDTSGVTGEGWVPIAGAEVRMHCTTHDYQEVFLTDDEGRIVVENLPAGRYMIQAEKSNEAENILILGQKERMIVYEPAGLDTVFMKYITASPLVLNEVYYCGCNRSSFYFYDQFIELYNSSNDTLYLDGYIMCRGTQITGMVDFEEVDYAMGYYVYAFPGERGVTKLCPIPPKGFLVIAGDALNHNHPQRPLCVDLENADWEFFNSMKSDYDNPNVRNLEPITTWGVDFTYNLFHAALWLATGEEYVFEYHWDGNKDQLYCHVPLWTIIDGVEYSGNPDSEKYMTIRVDAGLGGNGMAKYSGLSIERRFPGLDSNNSTFDFEIISPTPGYQH